MTRALRALLLELDLAHLRWALRELPPLHQDVPGLVVRIQQLEDERRARLAC